MAHPFRCPICGSLAWSSSLDKKFDIETYRPVSLGKAHGFRYEKIENSPLVDRVLAKIRELYLRFAYDD